MKRLAFLIFAFCLWCYDPPPLPAQDEATYPAPVSEYAEQTGPNTIYGRIKIIQPINICCFFAISPMIEETISLMFISSITPYPM